MSDAIPSELASALTSDAEGTRWETDSESMMYEDESEKDEEEILFKGLAMHSFNAQGYGLEYLSLTAGERVFILEHPEGVDSQGWEYGLCPDGWRKGWFPPLYVAISL